MMMLVSSSVGYVYLKAAFNAIYVLYDHLHFCLNSCFKREMKERERKFAK